jgi:hypothetical protein
MRPLVTALGLVLILALAVPATAGTLAGVTMADTAQAGDQQLKLNGMGLREKLWIDVYVAGLYLPAEESSSEKILADDGPRHLVMHFVYDVDQGKICDAWNESLEANVANAGAALKKDFETLCTWMEDFADGEEMACTYIPGKGTEITVKGTSKGTIEGKEFADALYSSWIGEHPATEKLKKGLLGK